MKLQTRITLFSTIFMLVLIVIVNTIIYFMFYKISTENELEQLVDQANTITETMNDNPDIPVKNLLQAFLPAHGTIRMLDEGGKEIIPTLTKQEEYTKVKATFSDKETNQVIKDEDGAYAAVVQKPIITQDGKIATLQVVNYLVTLGQTMRTLLYVLIATSLLILIPTVTGGNALSRFILQPIKMLINTMKENTREEKWKMIPIKNRSKDELYEMETTFNEMIHHLKDSFQKQEAFVSNASHELKTPIAIMKSYAQLLKRRGKTHPEVLQESVDAIDLEADRMDKLVHQMLTLAKRKEMVEIEPIDLVALTEKITATFTNAYDREIQFHAQADSLMLKGNHDQLEQVIYILLDNAIKYSSKAVKVLLLKQQDIAMMQVTDHGQGIAEEDIAYVFDRFYRVDKARTRSTGGTGLGLSIAKAIMEMHDGEIEVQSVVGKGTTFTLKFPLTIEGK